jgi:hypothetical protein
MGTTFTRWPYKRVCSITHSPTTVCYRILYLLVRVLGGHVARRLPRNRKVADSILASCGGIFLKNRIREPS